MRLAFALALWASALAAAPAPSLKPLIVLDPGHGGQAAGARAGESGEAALVFEIASQVAALLKAQGVECVLSRDAQSGPTAAARASFANASGARAFVSLHLNHSPSPGAHGPRIFIPKPQPPLAKDEPSRWAQAASQKAEEAKALAVELAKSLGQSESSKVNVQNLNLAAFRGLALPGVVVELGFLSHAESRERFLKPEYRRAVAGRVAQGLLSWAASASGAEARP